MSRHSKHPFDHLLATVVIAVVLATSTGSLLAQDAAKYVGTNSCAAANCHGGDGSGPPWTSSYSDWVQRDLSLIHI